MRFLFCWNSFSNSGFNTFAPSVWLENRNFQSAFAYLQPYSGILDVVILPAIHLLCFFTLGLFHNCIGRFGIAFLLHNQLHRKYEHIARELSAFPPLFQPTGHLGLVCVFNTHPTFALRKCSVTVPSSVAHILPKQPG